MKYIFHIDFNSYFATVEQQANPRLRGKPIGVTGGDRMERTVLGTASVEAKKMGVRGGMTFWEAKKICPEIILVRGDSDKYLTTTKKFLSILKDYSPIVEVFSIDEAFLELSLSSVILGTERTPESDPGQARMTYLVNIATEIKDRIRCEIGEWITCSIGVSYNKVIAKLAGSLYKPDGLVIVEDPQAARWLLDRLPLDEVCGIGSRITKRLNNMGVFDFPTLRKVPLECLLASFKSYGKFLYDISRGENYSELTPFYEKEEVKSIGHRHTLNQDTSDEFEIKQILLKITELIARRLRAKNLVGRTVVCYFRRSKNLYEHQDFFTGDGMQITIPETQDGLDIFNGAWKIFKTLWGGKRIRMVGATISNLKPLTPENLSLLEDKQKEEIIFKTIDKINDKYGEFVLKRASVLNSANVYRKPNPYLSDRRFKL
jgi:DNA polymerase IV